MNDLSDRELLLLVNERVYRMEKSLEDNTLKINVLEIEFIKFKTEIEVKMKIYTAMAISVASIIGTVGTFVVDHFLK